MQADLYPKYRKGTAYVVRKADGSLWSAYCHLGVAMTAAYRLHAETGEAVLICNEPDTFGY